MLVKAATECNKIHRRKPMSRYNHRTNNCREQSRGRKRVSFLVIGEFVFALRLHLLAANVDTLECTPLFKVLQCENVIFRFNISISNFACGMIRCVIFVSKISYVYGKPWCRGKTAKLFRLEKRFQNTAARAEMGAEMVFQMVKYFPDQIHLITKTTNELLSNPYSVDMQAAVRMLRSGDSFTLYFCSVIQSCKCPRHSDIEPWWNWFSCRCVP